jgi:hypothetical protein
MKNNVTSRLLLAALLGLTSQAFAATLLSDDFESGIGAWTQSANPLTLDTAFSQGGGANSAYMNTSGDFMGRSIVGDVLGTPITASVWLYDAGTAANRAFLEVGNMAAGGYVIGSAKNQALAAGKYSSNTKTGEPAYTATKYSGRLLYPSATGGWFNLNDPGSPNASRPAWHKFTIERLADNTTINYYVDDILSRTMTGANAYTWNYIAVGFGAGTTVGDAWFDNASVVSIIPEPSTAFLGLLGGLGMMWITRRRKA